MRLGVLSDIHAVVAPATPAAWHNDYDFAGLTRRLQEARRLFVDEVDAVCLLGDLTHHGQSAALNELGALIALLDVPTIVVAGNHDAQGPDELVAELSNVTLANPVGILIDGVRVAGIHVQRGDWFGAHSDSPPAIERWAEEPTVLLSHYPLLSHATRLAERGMPYPGDLLDRAEISGRLIARPAPTVVLSGHIHARDTLYEGSLLQLTQAAVVEPPYECCIVELASDAAKLTITREAHPLGGPPPSGSYTPVLVPPRQQLTYEVDSWSAAVSGVAVQ